MRFHSVVALFLAAGSAAQGSYIVDASGGPGSHFVDIQAAVQAVPSGSVLLVRAGSYSPVHVDGKGLAIVCDQGVTIAPPVVYATGPFLSITNTQPNHVVSVFGLGFGPIGLQFHDGILVQNAMGLVVIDGQGSTLESRVGPMIGIGATLKIANSSQVVIRDFVLRGGTMENPGAAAVPQMGSIVDNSSVVFERCILRGSNNTARGHVVWAGKSALAATDSRIDLVETSVIGGNGWSTTATWWVPPGPVQFPADAAVTASNAQLVVRGSAAQAITGGIMPAVGTLPAVQLDAVVGSGSMRVDPSMPVLGAVAAGVQVTVAALSRLTSNMPMLGGVASATCSAQGGSLVAVALGQPAPASTLFGLADPLWLGGTNSSVVDFGFTSAVGQFVAGVPVPNLSSLLGIPFVWQAAEIGATGVAALTNPSVAHVR